MKRFIFYSMLLVILFIACDDDDVSKPSQTISRTIIVYMAADNDLSEDALNDIDEMEQNFSETGVNLLVFVDLKNKLPYLLKINKQSSSIIKTYPELNSSDYVELRAVLNECLSKYPANEYGLILWSHASSWLPEGSQLRSFGEDSGKQMNISDLAQALPVKFDFILFDACLMGSVEVAYELKDKTNYIIASSTETIAEGFPYSEVIPLLLESQINLQKVAENYFNYYNSQNGAYRSATVSLIRTATLPELASETNAIITNNVIDPGFDRKYVQRLDTYKESYIFDLLDFINQAYPDADKSYFINKLNETILYKANTPMFLLHYPIDKYCGLSSYIIHPQRQDINNFYQTLKWYTESGVFMLFNL